MEINAAFFYTFFIGLLLVLAYCSRWRRYFQLGMKLPGPPALPIIGNCLQFTTNDLHKCFQEFTEIARSYVPIVRLWIGPVLIVVVTDPDCIEMVVKHDKLSSRGYLVKKTGEQFFRNGLFIIDGEEWRRHRKIVSAALHVNILETFVEIFAKNSEILANKLKTLADGITAHDIAPYFMRCTLDIIVQTSSSLDINAQNDNDDSTLNNMKTVVDTTVVRVAKPWLLFDWVFNATELGKKYYKAVKCEHDRIFNEVERMKKMRETAKKRRQNEEKLSIIELLIQHGEISKEEVVGEIATIKFAGTETTSLACGYVLALLGENQHIQERVMQEQQDIFGDDILRPVRSDDLQRMVYLEQVGNCLLRSSLFSRTVAIFLHDIHRSCYTHTHKIYTYIFIYM
jgi:cytochrome P450